MRIIHLFNWRLKDIDLYKIKEQGFNAIQINPLQGLKSDGYDWWLSYQPINFIIGNKYGTKEDLKGLCDTANLLNIIVIADVVINHVAGCDDGSITPHELVGTSIIRANAFKSFGKIYNYSNREEVISKSIGLPCLDLSNFIIQGMVFSMLDDYISLGVKGFRIDAAKHIALPCEGSSFFKRLKDEIVPRTSICYAEVIFCERHILYEYSKYCSVLTDGYIEEEDKLITFVESHDSYLEFGYTRGMNDSDIEREYYVLVKRFKNTIFYSRPYSSLWKMESIKKINNNY